MSSAVDTITPPPWLWRKAIVLVSQRVAAFLPGERYFGLAEVAVGTLAYMAPEQTLRIDRSVDSRSDLYSLGVTLYQLLVGALPFTAGDPMEWMHCHIARVPVAPKVRLNEIPELSPRSS